ncbi:AGAP007979-PA-like protein [Anopheles sinensis]|uniref:AGAP007979-PA-like protein n=1 Tax=Anopheles sinensis TaxID=74873 RepID=A0A084W5Y6_ANOSI|nr:AGAP007979-PA-like protein [Anopheles sinensis]
MDDVLFLSNESGFQSDWKTIYHRDALFWASHEYHTDGIMRTLVPTVSYLTRQFNLSPAIEFAIVETLELLLVRVFQSWKKPTPTFLDGLERHKRVFLKHLPLYTVAVVDIVTKYIEPSIKLDLPSLKRIAKVDYGADQNMLAVEFEVIKLLDCECRASLLLGAVERFSKDYLLPLNVASKETIAHLGIKLLRVVTADRMAIYSSLETFMKDAAAFRRFKSSKLILAGSIVITILYLMPKVRHSRPILQQILEPLADECCIQATNLLYLRDAILRVIGKK